MCVSLPTDLGKELSPNLFLLKRWHVVTFSMRFDVTAWSLKDPNEVLAGGESWALDIFILSLSEVTVTNEHVCFRESHLFLSDHI